MGHRILPLFPLPVVLFPGTLIPLHIFEPRYREMVSRILESDRSFGLLYHDPDEMGPFMNEPGRIGTVAEVKKHQLLPGGRSLILVRGMERFRVVEEVQEGAPFYEARVAGVNDSPAQDPAGLVRRREGSLALFQTVLQTLPHVPDALPSFNIERELSFKLAAAARMDPIWQQEILEMREEEARLDRLDPVFRFGITHGQQGGKAQA